MSEKYEVSFHCYFPGTGNITRHRQTMPLKDIKKWVEAYRYTHPMVQSITVKIWFTKEAEA